MKPNKNEFRRPLDVPFACCGNCRFYFADGGPEDDGDCRRYPPVVFPGNEDLDDDFLHPTVERLSWCGEWKRER
jgi:hypothetical protein